jgi:proteasome lid subunit RPN8/RPN11
MSIQIDAAQRSEIERHGESGYPNEICGIMLGNEQDGRKTLRELLPVENRFEAEEQYHRFLITPEEMFKAEKRARAAGFSVVGFYHSHPDHPAIASEYDRDHAWPWYSYIIVSVREGSAREMRSWTLRDDRSAFDEEQIESGEL